MAPKNDDCQRVVGSELAEYRRRRLEPPPVCRCVACERRRILEAKADADSDRDTLPTGLRPAEPTSDRAFVLALVWFVFAVGLVAGAFAGFFARALAAVVVGVAS